MADSSQLQQAHGAEPSREAPAEGGHETSEDRTRFTSHGAIPAVGSTGAAAGGPRTSASDLAFGAGKSVDSALPAGVDVQSVRASVEIPSGRKLAGGYLSGGTVKTKEPCQVGVEATHTGVRLYVEPGLYLDADWPLQDCRIGGAGFDFAKRQPYAEVDDVPGLGTGMISIAGRVSKKLTDMIRTATANTRLAEGHYDPGKDPDLRRTLDQVLAGFVAMFAEQDPKHAAAKDKKGPPITPGEMKNVSAGATIAVKNGARFASPDGSGLTIDANGPISISVEGAGSLGDEAAAHDAASAVDAMNLQSVELSTEAMQVVVKGKPVAKIEAMTLHRGGKVTIDRMTPLGKLATAEAVESGLSLLAALVAVRSNDPSAGGLYDNAQHPAVVDGVSRAMIEEQFTQTIHKMIVEYRGVVPGVDLARALGIG